MWSLGGIEAIGMLGFSRTGVWVTILGTMGRRICVFLWDKIGITMLSKVELIGGTGLAA